MSKKFSARYYVRNWRVFVDRENREIILINSRNRIMTITRNTKVLNGLPSFIVEHLIISNLIPNYLKVE